MPYHRRYHGDALGGYSKLTLEQRGAYTTILDLIYDAGGPIDNNERWLSGMLNCSIRKARALVSELLTLRKLFINSAGQISNRRAEDELENSLKISRKRAENASKPKRNDDENKIFRNKISDGAEQMQGKSAVIPEPEPYNNNLGSSEYVDTEPPNGQGVSVAATPPIPIDKLTGNVRLIEALNGRSKGRGDLDALLRGVRKRRGG